MFEITRVDCISIVIFLVFRFGRKKTLCTSSIFYLTAAMSIAWTPSYAIYLLLIFAVGFFSVGNFMPAFVMGNFHMSLSYVLYRPLQPPSFR